MKLFYKGIMSLILVSLFFRGYSQVTVDSLSIFNDDMIITTTDSAFAPVLQEAGENLIWNFSDLKGERVDTLIPLKPEQTDFANEFPEADFAFEMKGIFLMFSLDENGFVNLGVGGDVANMDIRSNLALHNSPGDTILKLPLNYLDEGEANSRGETDFDVEMFGTNVRGRVSHTVHREQIVDAWGTMTTPLGTYDVLRLKEHTIMTDSVFVTLFGLDVYQKGYSRFDTTDTYSFYTQTDKESFLVATINYNEGENKEVKAISWRSFLSSNSAVKELSEEATDWTIYPNPTSGVFRIHTEELFFDVTVYNCLGKRVLSQKNNDRIDLRACPQGVYLVQVEGENIHSTKKVILTK